MWYDGKGSLAGLLELVVENYETDRQQYWSDDPTEAERLQLLDQIGSALLRASEEMQATHAEFEGVDFDWPILLALARHSELRQQVLEKLEIDAAYEVVGKTADMAARCLELTEHVLQEMPDEHVLRFIRRLSRCYIAGFMPEVVIICRSVLENALVDAFDRKRIPLPSTPEGKSSMRARIEAAKRLQFMSPRAAEEALDVWARGNTAVHKDPQATQRVFETVRKTMGVLKELYA